jgi:uncharacterized protein (TIGR02145 family)
MKNLILYLTITFFIISMNIINAQDRDSIKDKRDGQVYKIVKIGDQFWMAENLRFESKAGFSWFTDAPQYRKPFGCYYYFDVAKSVCAEGWHLPSDKEWQALADFLGGVYFAGIKLKTKEPWMPPNTGANNSTGFTALPAGFQDLDGSFVAQGSEAYFWSSDVTLTGTGSMWLVGSSGPGLRNSDYDKKSRLNVRCIKDTPLIK